MRLLDKTIDQIAREIPGSTLVFERNNVLVEQHSEMMLKELLQQSAISKHLLLSELTNLTELKTSFNAWHTSSNRELIDYIVQRYHERHRQNIDDLCSKAAKVETNQSQHPSCPKGLTEHLENLKLKLELHMINEQYFIFPDFAKYSPEATTTGIYEAKNMHKEIWRDIQQIVLLTNQLRLSEDACDLWHDLYLSLKSFTLDVTKTIFLEENILFERKGNLNSSTFNSE